MSRKDKSSLPAQNSKNSRQPPVNPVPVRAWREGNRLFNQGRYFEAHEAWETGWTRLPEPQRTAIQVVIQGAGVFVLLSKGRTRAAGSLARAALNKFAALRKTQARALTRVMIPGLQKLLCALIRDEPIDRLAVDRILTKARALRAFLRVAE